MKRLCVIIPVYKTLLSEQEEYAVERYLSELEKYDIYFMGPKNLDRRYYNRRFPTIKYKEFNSRFFRGTKSYNRLMLSSWFYESFCGYKYMLIAQTDALLIGDVSYLEEVMDKGYDYVGAPWFDPLYSVPLSIKDRIKKLIIAHPEHCIVGNGGFSLRNIQAAVCILREHALFLKLFWHFNEDYFFSYRGNIEKYKFKIAPLDVAQKFALEQHMNEFINRGEIPMAVHGWEKYYKDYNSLLENLNKAR